MFFFGQLRDKGEWYLAKILNKNMWMKIVNKILLIFLGTSAIEIVLLLRINEISQFQGN